MSMTSPLPKPNCTLCPRLAMHRENHRIIYPDYFNAPVPCFGDPNAKLLIVGQAPGWNGANRTGRPFTGDKSGELLYGALREAGFATGNYGGHKDDGVELKDCMVTNAVRCAPNKDEKHTDAHELESSEIIQCRQFLKARIEEQKNNGLKAIIALGLSAYSSVLMAQGLPENNESMKKLSNTKKEFGGIVLYASYHPSPRTRQWMSQKQFIDQFATIKKDLLIAE
ncbi:MAG: uracil-DNA glycosylase [Alphaproteobacteria bacterium]|nr:uracil-DNA glycosylase [Alphaproteobacteria bacterium]MBE8221042.1 uracil-DNA glycosylase [Alphaproteobacteria bacterium]